MGIIQCVVLIDLENMCCICLKYAAFQF